MEELDCLGTVLLVTAGGLRELSMVDGFMADGLVEAEKRKGSGMMIGGRKRWGTNKTTGVK